MRMSEGFGIVYRIGRITREERPEQCRHDRSFAKTVEFLDRHKGNHIYLVGNSSTHGITK